MEQPARLLPGPLLAPRADRALLGAGAVAAERRPERQGQRAGQAPGDPEPTLWALHVPRGPAEARRRDAKRPLGRGRARGAKMAAACARAL